jgi:hypothetical protein
MKSEAYDALTAAGAPEDKACKAAEALTRNEDCLAKVGADLLLVKQMMRFVLAFQVAIVAKLFSH